MRETELTIYATLRTPEGVRVDAELLKQLQDILNERARKVGRSGVAVWSIEIAE
jgi:hypothetical protein